MGADIPARITIRNRIEHLHANGVGVLAEQNIDPLDLLAQDQFIVRGRLNSNFQPLTPALATFTDNREDITRFHIGKTHRYFAMFDLQRGGHSGQQMAQIWRSLVGGTGKIRTGALAEAGSLDAVKGYNYLGEDS
jgi:hypothetical protein